MLRKLAYVGVAAATFGGMAVAAPAQAAPDRAVGAHCIGDTDGRLLSCHATQAEAQRATDGMRGWIP